VGLATGLAVLASLSAPVSAQSIAAAAATPTEPHFKAVLELFTSQGCSSCPPADALLHDYAERKDVVALTMPVDYWDYLGWKDTLANPKFSARQRAYAKDRGDGRIYTPQMVINGVIHVNGSSREDIENAIQRAAPHFEKTRVPLSIKKDGSGHVIIHAGDAPEGSDIREATIWLAVIQREVEIPVRAGENHGKTLKYANVVRELIPIGMWNGEAAQFQLDRETILQPGAGSCAIIVQTGKAGPIIGAAMLPKL
jgi:hypothetical protein